MENVTSAISESSAALKKAYGGRAAAKRRLAKATESIFALAKNGTSGSALRSVSKAQHTLKSAP
jgi:hypothetical protein